MVRAADELWTAATTVDPEDVVTCAPPSARAAEQAVVTRRS
jgi:hypothetical protein